MSAQMEYNQFMKELEGLARDFQGFGIKYKEYGDSYADIEKKYGKLEDIVEKMQLERATSASGAVDLKSHPEMKMLAEWIRTGDETEFKAARNNMTVNDGVSGGVLAPPVFVNQILLRLTDEDILRKYANIIQVNGAVAQIPVDLDDGGAQWVGETENRDDTGSPQLGMENIQMNEVQATFGISRNLLSFGAINVEQYAINKISQKLSKAEGAAFIKGDGHKKPEGLFSCKRVDKVKAGSTTAISYDSMVDLWTAVPTAVDANARFVMNKKTAGVLMKLKDENAVPLWNQPIAAGMPPTFIGFEVVLTPSAPNVASGATPIAFGDLRSAFTIIDGMDMTLIRDEVSAKRKGLVEFTLAKQTGGQVAMPSSLRTLEMKA